MKTGDVAFGFPVLGFTRDLDLWGFADLEALTACGPLTLKEDKLPGMELVDAEGRRWTVTSVRRVGPAKTGLAGLIEPLLYAKRTSRIEHELDALTPLTLAEVKARLVAGIEAFPDYWGDDAEEVAGRVAEVRAVSTIAEVHSVLGLDDFRSY